MGKYFLIHSLGGNVIASGSREECERVLEAFVRYGIREDKFDIVDETVNDIPTVKCCKEDKYLVCSCDKCLIEGKVIWD